MPSSFFGANLSRWTFVPLMGALCFGIVRYLPGCDDITDGSSDDGDAGCNGATCSSSQFCLYRACTAAQKCVASSDPCDGVASCALADGTPGCANPTCAPTVQGCRDIPSTCGNDVSCACDSVCGGASMCESVDGGSATCSGS